MTVPTFRFAFPFLLLRFIALLQPIQVSASYFFCSKNAYLTPLQQDCFRVLGSLPPADVYSRYFAEQQLNTGPPSYDWPQLQDSRPKGQAMKIVQIPKFWSSGTCNLALTSYVRADIKIAMSTTTWADVYTAASQLLQVCLDRNKQGGAVTVDGPQGVPVLTVFIWQNGALFDIILNQYMSAMYPSGIDPSFPPRLQLFNTSSSGLDLANSTVNLSAIANT